MLVLYVMFSGLKKYKKTNEINEIKETQKEVHFSE